ncbi:MAG: hypothetical protein H6918_06880 [Sphingomonadaceae bacterium]|nr:hypothetical protein [Sphingomonadaceae bacterium]MCP5396443.1 hypothetical protein [Sphingomonadaceae bacterium]
MRRGAVASLSALALLTLPWPRVVAAQEATPLEQIDPDLRCTIWSGAILQLMGEADGKTAITAAFTFFMGRFEGRTGEAIEQAMTKERIELVTADMAASTEFCAGQMQVLGDRLSNFGRELQRMDGSAEGQ